MLADIMYKTITLHTMLTTLIHLSQRVSIIDIRIHDLEVITRTNRIHKVDEVCIKIDRVDVDITRSTIEAGAVGVLDCE
jgi:hypothetical protein